MEPTIEELNASLTKQVGDLTAQASAYEAVIKGKDEALATSEAKVKELSEAVALLSREKEQAEASLKAEQEKAASVAKEAAKVAASVGLAPLAATPAAPAGSANRNSIIEEFTKLQRSGDARAAKAFYDANRAVILGR